MSVKEAKSIPTPTTTTEYADDIFGFDKLSFKEQEAVSASMYRNDISPDIAPIRRMIEINLKKGKISYNKDIGKTHYNHIDQTVLGAINTEWAVLLKHTPKNDNDNDTHIVEHRTDLIIQERSDYCSFLQQQFLRCTDRNQYNGIVGGRLQHVKKTKDESIRTSLNRAMQLTKPHYDKLPEKSDTPMIEEVEERPFGPGLYSFETITNDNPTPKVATKPETYHVLFSNLSKPGWKTSKFSFTCLTNSTPVVTLNGNTCVIAVYENERTVNVYTLDKSSLNKASLVQVTLPEPFPSNDSILNEDEKNSLVYRNPDRLPQLCLVFRYNYVAVGYGNGVAVLDINTNVCYHHRIRPPISVFDHCVTAIELGDIRQLYLGTRLGQVWIANDFKQPIQQKLPEYTFDTILPIRQIRYIPAHKSYKTSGKLCASTVSQVAFLRGPGSGVYTMTHVGQSVVLERPIGFDMCGSLIFVLTKPGRVNIIETEPNRISDGEDDLLMLPATTEQCFTQHMTPWYTAIHADLDRIFVLYPDGVIRVWFAVSVAPRK